nr:spore germination protein [Peribacillus alkalitolerans]
MVNAGETSGNSNFGQIDLEQSKFLEKNIPNRKGAFLDLLSERIQMSSDVMIVHPTLQTTLVYIDTLIDKNLLQDEIIYEIKKSMDHFKPAELMKKFNISDIKRTENIDQAIHSLLLGNVIIHTDGYPFIIQANITTSISRSITKPENESQVIGPQIGFNESLSTNISLIRRYLTNPNLSITSFELGKQTRTAISVLYIKDIASEEMVHTLTQRISDIKIDSIIDSSVLAQLIDDNSLSIFPQMILSERPDWICSNLLNGKLAVLVDGSPLAICCPQSFIEFFKSMEDQNVRWHIATFIRILRILAMLLSVFFTAIYVAALTFHYEVIPQPLLIPLSESRSRVPFPPIFEAILLEFIIELLREAGARLPTKVGQTMGIVGGIVIGTAAVQAGFTSNILIIIIALGALASFTTPSYMMGNVIRIIRFPLIMLAGFWGFYGIFLGFCFAFIHLLRQSSLGTPYLAPFYPPRLRDWKDSIFRLPFVFTYNRPQQSRPKESIKYNPKENKTQNDAN